MSWIVDDWRLKLLALGLAILMLGAVAFSQNPPTTRSLSLPLRYTTIGESQNLVILNPPSTVTIIFSGLADVIGAATSNNFSATVDASHAVPGQAVKLNINVQPTINVTIQPVAPIVVRIDNLVGVDVAVTVVAHGSSNWTVTKTAATPGTVHFIGPQSLEAQIKAFVTIPGQISANATHLLNQQITLANTNGALNLTPCTTVPCPSLDVSSVAVDITAQTGTTSSTVPLVAQPPSQPPPAGYQITRIDINPLTVIITGDPAAIAKALRIVLPAVDLSSSTTTVTFTVQIQYPDGVTALGGLQTAKITYTIQKNPSVSPSP